MVAQLKEIHQLRTPRAFAGARKISLVDDRIDRTGFTRIGAACKRDFRTRIRDKLARLVGAGQDWPGDNVTSDSLAAALSPRFSCKMRRCLAV